jgi:hypothetical protein
LERSKISSSWSKAALWLLDIHGVDRGYLLVFDFNKNKEFKEERINIEEKEIFQVYV